MKIKIALLSFTIIALNLPVFGENDPWDFQFDNRKWEIGYSHFQSSTQGGIEYVLLGESVTNWSELVTSQFSTDLDGFNLDGWLNGFTESMSKKYTTFKWEKIPMNDGTLLFEWSHQGGDVWPAQHEIKRGIQINNSVYFLSYVKKTKKLEPEIRQQWIKILKSAVCMPLGSEAQQISPPAQLYLEALRYFNAGEKEKAIPMIRRAAEMRNVDAQWHMGGIYLNGDGVEKNPVEAVKWFGLAARQNHHYAQYQLGKSYILGRGVTEDFATGFAWLLVSAENGNSEALEMIQHARPLFKDQEHLQQSLAIRKTLMVEIENNVK